MTIPPEIAAALAGHGEWRPTLGEAMGSPVGAALWYAARGWRVHPLHDGEKKPRLDDWPAKATTDSATVVKWWTKWPAANVGIVTGGGLVVVDVDPRNGGLATFERMRARLPNGAVPPTWRVRTARGGYHLYFDATGLSSPPKFGEGVDTPLNVAAPPSVVRIDGQEREYVVERAVPLAPFPREWLAPEREAAKPVARVVGTDDVALAKRALGRLSALRADDYEPWLKVGMALHAVSDALLPEWDEWSRQSPKYAEGACADKWRGFRPKEHGLTVASLVSWAREDELRRGLRFAADVKTEPIDWLWYGRIAFGKIQGLVGLPDQGKDVVALNIAARVSKGAPMPDGRPSTRGDPRPVYYLSVEDALGDTLKPRFVAAGGDPRYLASRLIVTRDGEDAQLALDAHLDAIRWDLAEMRRVLGAGPGLIILSPIDAFFSAKVDAWKAADMRRAIAPVARLAEESGWAVLGILHLNKDQSQAPIHRIANSQALGAALRLAYLAAADPSDATGARRVFLPMKRNLIPPEVAGLAYDIISVATPGIPNPGPNDTVPVAKWHPAPVRLTAAEALAGREPLSKEDAAAAWLLDRLDAHRSEEAGADGDDLQRDAEAAGHAWPTVRAAAKKVRATGKQTKDVATGRLGPSRWWLEGGF